MFKWPSITQYARDLAERIAPTGWIGADPPHRQARPEPLPEERWLRDEETRSNYAVNPRAAAGGGAAEAPVARVNGKKIKQVITLDLSTARTDSRIVLDGNILVYNDSTAGTDRIKVRLAQFDGDQAAPQITLRPGEFIGGEPYRLLLLTNTAQAGSTAELWLCEDEGQPFTYR